MSGILPVAVYALRIPPGDILIPAMPDFAAMFRVTMAAIDPTEEPETQDVDDKTERSTLKLVRLPFDESDDDDSEDDEDYTDEDDDEEEDSDESDEEANGGPSDPKKVKKSQKKALLEQLAADEDEDMEEDEDDDDDPEEQAKALAKIQKAIKTAKGKGKAVNGEEDSEDDEDSKDLDDTSIDLDEVVVCTLDPKQHYQQTLDFVVGEGEKVFFKVSGTHTVHLTGNYMIPEDDGMASLYDDDEEEEYDLSPDEDELDALDALADGASESDELDDLEDPRVTEVDSKDEEGPKLIKDTSKGKNKRLAEDSEEEEEAEEATLDSLLAKSIKKEENPTAAPATNSETKKLSKAEKKRLKKLKKNDGEAAPAPAAAAISADGARDSPTATKKEQQPNGTASAEKKVQFAKNLEQGPTPSSSSSGGTAKPTIGIREVQGIKIDDRKLGSGPAAKKGSRLELRYIGKLTDGKVFDANKSGKPFSVKLGAGEVIKGWDIGLEGIQVGGERRITIPAKHGYGNKALPQIPAGSTLVFDVKCLTVK